MAGLVLCTYKEQIISLDQIIFIPSSIIIICVHVYCLHYNRRNSGNYQWPSLQKSYFKKVGVGYRTFEIRDHLSPKLVPCPKILNPKPQPQINTANLKLQRRLCLERIVLHPNFCTEDHCQIPNVCTLHIFLPPKKRIRMRGKMRL